MRTGTRFKPSLRCGPAVGAPGSESDGGIYNRSGLKDAIENNTLNLPLDEPKEGMADDVPYFFLGYDVFPLQKRMMKPYGHMVYNSQRAPL